MNALIVYESMFGNTRRLAEAMAEALETSGADVTVSPACDAPADLSDYTLVVVGAPTHAHSLPRPKSRAEAAEWAVDPTKKLSLEEKARATGVREWLEGIMLVGNPRFAVFSTRVDIPRIFSGDAAAAITEEASAAVWLTSTRTPTSSSVRTTGSSMARTTARASGRADWSPSRAHSGGRGIMSTRSTAGPRPVAIAETCLVLLRLGILRPPARPTR